MTNQTTTKYEVRKMLGGDLSPYILRYLWDASEELDKLYPEFKFQWKKYPWRRFCDDPRGMLLVCFENGRPIGFLMASYGAAFFDMNIRTLTQQTLYCKPGSRASKLLMETFIDIGRKTADRIFTCIGKKTNIKPASLERLGFMEMETLYRLET